MKTSKKEIFGKYGIEYRDGKILSPIGWIKPLLKEGNSKTGKAVLTWSMLPGNGHVTIAINGKPYTVYGTCVCNCVGCYAQTGFYKMSSVIRSLAINTYLVNNFSGFVKNAIMAQLETMGRGEIRIHASGDFNTEKPNEYSALWHEIAKDFPSFRF